MASGRRFSRSQSALPSISVTQDSTTPSTSKVPGSQLHTGAIVDIWIDTEEKWSRAKLGSKLSRGNDDDEVRYKIEFEDKNRADREFPFVPDRLSCYVTTTSSRCSLRSSRQPSTHSIT